MPFRIKRLGNPSYHSCSSLNIAGSIIRFNEKQYTGKQAPIELLKKPKSFHTRCNSQIYSLNPESRSFHQSRLLNISLACQPIQLGSFCGLASKALRRARGRLPRECGLRDLDERNPAVMPTRSLPPEICHIAVPAEAQPPSRATPAGESSGECAPGCATSPLPRAKYQIHATVSLRRQPQ